MSEYEEYVCRFYPDSWGEKSITLFGVPIVRCRDCRHMRTIDLSVYYGEHKHDLEICIRVDGVQLNAEPDGFCAWGERE